MTSSISVSEYSDIGFRPQLSRQQHELRRGDGAFGLKFPPALLQRDQPQLDKPFPVEGTIHGGAMAQRPEGLASLINVGPSRGGLDAKTDEAAGDMAPALPLRKQQGA